MGVDLTSPITIDGMTLGVVADRLHSVPRAAAPRGRRRQRPDDQPPGHRRRVRARTGHPVPLSFAPVTGSWIRLVVDTYRPVDPDGSNAIRPDTLPVSLATVGLGRRARARRPDHRER